MFAKIVVIFCLIAATQADDSYGSTAIGYAGGLGYGSGLGYASGYGSSSYGLTPYSSYASPVVKALTPVAYTAPIAYTPAISTVSQYSIHQAPIVKSYAPIVNSYASPYLSHGYTGYVPAVSYSNYNSYGYSGYGGKYAW